MLFRSHYWQSNSPCYFNASVGAKVYVNFFNPLDYALNLWLTDQFFKPDLGANYGYDGTNFFQGCTFPNAKLLLLFPADTYEIFAYCDPATCFALGAQADVSGQFKMGMNFQQVQLDTAPYNYTSTHRFHSAQFRSSMSQRATFWAEVLRRMRLKN